MHTYFVVKEVLEKKVSYYCYLKKQFNVSEIEVFLSLQYKFSFSFLEKFVKNKTN